MADSVRRAGRPDCEARGCCGPFVNRAYYTPPGSPTEFADCVECGCRVAVPRRDRGFGSLGGMIEAVIPPSTMR